MKRFAALALILSIAMFSFGCDGKKADKKPGDSTKPAATKKDDGGDKTKADPAKKDDTTKKDAEPAKK